MREFDEMKLARVIDACEGIDGRVKMQKIIYLLRAMGYSLPFDDFTIRQHGPFSRAVACCTDVLKEAVFVEEDRERLDETAGGKPVFQYNYTIRKEIAPLVREHFEVRGPDAAPPLDEVATFLKQQHRAVLEVAATRLFLQREWNLDGEELEKTLQNLKGHLRSHFIAANQLLSELQQRGWLESISANEPT